MLTKFSFDLAWLPRFQTPWPSFKADLEIKMNILSDIHDDYFKNVTSGVLTRLCFDLTW